MSVSDNLDVYELWHVSSYGPGEPPMPLTLEAKSESFSKIYSEFVRYNEKAPCVIVLNKKKR